MDTRTKIIVCAGETRDTSELMRAVNIAGPIESVDIVRCPEGSTPFEMMQTLGVTPKPMTIFEIEMGDSDLYLPDILKDEVPKHYKTNKRKW